jgi:rare lipoprotein A
LAERYTGRHIRQARHGAWVTKKRSRTQPPRQLLPAAAALTVAGVLVGGVGAAFQLNPPGQRPQRDLALGLDPADYSPPDRDAAADRASRDADRAPAADGATDTGATGAKDEKKADERANAAPGNRSVISTGSCRASYHTGDGGLTAAHRTLPFGTRVRVTGIASGDSVVVRITDRGPYVSGRCLNLSAGAFDEIADLGAGVVNVRYEVLAEDAT